MIYKVKVTAEIDVSVDTDSPYTKDDIQAIALDAEVVDLMNWIGNQGEDGPDCSYVRDVYTAVRVDIPDPLPEEEDE